MREMTYRLLPEVKARWLEALRSGRFEQGQRYLRFDFSRRGDLLRNDRFCCLGVLCDLYAQAKSTEVMWREDHIRNGQMNMIDVDGRVASSLPTPRVIYWACGPDYNPVLDPYTSFRVRFKPPHKFEREWYDLAALNDTYRLTFGQIANLIEEQL